PHRRTQTASRDSAGSSGGGAGMRRFAIVLACCITLVFAVVGRAGALTTSVKAATGMHQLRGIDCPNSTSCEVVGDTTSNPARGAADVVKSGTPGGRKSVADADLLSGVSCPSSTACEATGENTAFTHGLVVPIASGTPGA